MNENAAPIDAPSSDAPWRPAGAILIIDDDEAVLSVTKRQLDRLGVTTLTATNASSALAIFRESTDRISAVLIDLTLRDRGGEHMLAELRALRPDLPALFISGFITNDGAADRRTGYVAKPFRPANLLAALRTVTEGPL